ncbi:hypothetical protein RJ639_012809 [Escallonia herrerae]|uniref:Uncharacterized protein n=1 Tax=Escallonia herrerae TaxID=1293975 RepID=A0AA88VQW2_9ASTE|nr:hypothetical protein RJ639_012809 [Escallonia herrerae]
MPRSLFLAALLLSLLLSAAAHGGAHDDDGDSDPNSSEKPDLRSKPLILVKIWCLILVFIGTFVGGISPYFMKWNEGFLVLGTQFAGGVFLGTALMHFLSDSNETFGDLTSKAYPFAFLLASGGYLLTMLADCAVSYVYGKESNGSRGDDEHQGFENGKGSGNGRTRESQFQVPDQSVKAPVAAAASLGDSILLIVALPIGVAIGIIIDATTQGTVADWIYAISMGLACGVFIYVSINHLLSKGYTPQRPVLVDTPSYRFLAVLLGVGVIAVVMIWDT